MPLGQGRRGEQLLVPHILFAETDIHEYDENTLEKKKKVNLYLIHNTSRLWHFIPPAEVCLLKQAERWALGGPSQVGQKDPFETELSLWDWAGGDCLPPGS